jgi:hypothetical protein
LRLGRGENGQPTERQTGITVAGFGYRPPAKFNFRRATCTEIAEKVKLALA